MDKSKLIQQCKESYGKNVRLMHLTALTRGRTFEKAVELGCNEGYLLHKITAEKKIGYDLNPLEIFEDIEYRTADIQSLWEDDAGLVICSEVIEHIEDDRKVMKIFYKQLKKGGLLYLTTINRNIHTDKSQKDEERGHLRRYGDELKTLLEKVGFQTLRFYPIRSPHYYQHKGNLITYSPITDEIEGAKEASGWVYAGQKK